MKRKPRKDGEKPFKKFNKEPKSSDFEDKVEPIQTTPNKKTSPKKQDSKFPDSKSKKEFKPKDKKETFSKFSNSENKVDSISTTPKKKSSPKKQDSKFPDSKPKKEFKPKAKKEPFSKFYKKENPAKEFFEEDFDKNYVPPTFEKDAKKPFKKDGSKFSKGKFPKKKFDAKEKIEKTEDSPAHFTGKNNAPATHDAPVEEDMRLNKYIAHAGICSRRKAGEHIQKGDVTVNDAIVLEMGYKVQEADVVKFQGEVVKPTRNHVYILFNKPKNVITTLEDENGRKTVMDFVGDITKERVYPVGRLDRNTTGLLILTNDGAFAQRLSHPSFEVKKVYKAKLDKPLTEEHMDMIRNTLTLDDGPAPIVAIEYGDENNIIGIELHIGRNRIVRRIFEHLGYDVVKLDRVFYGGLTKKDLPVGKCRFLSKQELIILKHLV